MLFRRHLEMQTTQYATVGNRIIFFDKVRRKIIPFEFIAMKNLYESATLIVKDSRLYFIAPLNN
ncbi:hypothetical protein PSEUDO8AS_40009 [Pseudomonas sp. 8AS]|nr:hypothetical protein PSEUDO8AS_40009 [Pseudomonas sp. 8AS]